MSNFKNRIEPMNAKPNSEQVLDQMQAAQRLQSIRADLRAADEKLMRCHTLFCQLEDAARVGDLPRVKQLVETAKRSAYFQPF